MIQYLSKFRIIFLVGIICSFTTFVHAQQIKGVVSDHATGITMPGATVTVKGASTRGTITNAYGQYSIQASPGEELLVSFIGYVTKTIVVGNNLEYNVKLASNAEDLNEVVVIGYGTQKKEDLTGSIQTVSAEDFKNNASPSPQELINGKVAGVQITNGGGAPGSSTTIRVRGGSSLSANNDPLIVIDGVPVDNGEISGMSNPLDAINPTDIETFTVLKDASATAIYGSRAANGVILITTKQGSSQGLKVDYSGRISVGTVTETVDVLNRDEYSTLLKEKFPDNTGLMGDADTDWQDVVLGAKVSTDHSIAMAGNIKEVFPFRVSFGYNLTNGILETSRLERYTGTLNFNPSLFDDHLKLSGSLKAMNIRNRFADQGALGNAIGMDPTQIVSDPSIYGIYGGYYTWLSGSDDNLTPIDIAPHNPLAMLNQKSDKSKVNRVIGNLKLDYKAHFLPDLHAVLNLGLDYSKGRGNVIIDPQAAWDLEAFNRKGAHSDYEQRKRNLVWDSYLQYHQDLESIDSRFDIMAGYSWQKFWNEKSEVNLFNTPNDEGSFDRKPYILNRSENYLVSFYTRLNYTFKERYLLTFTFREDGSSKFSKSNRWGEFPSVALAWNMKKEKFLENVDCLSNLKLRTGYGLTGQQDIGTDYGYFGTYTISQPTAQYIYYDRASGTYKKIPINTYRPEGYDENLKWESTTTWNVGFDYGFFSNRISGTIDYYYRKTKDLLNQIPVAAGSNLENELITNVGSMKNQGIEFAINANVINRNDWNWDVSFNLSSNVNEITKLTAIDDPNYLGVQTGGIEGATGNFIQIHQVGQPVSSFFVYKQKYDNNGKPLEGEYEDLNGDGEISPADLRAYKDPTPKVRLGFSTNVSWKELDLSMSMRANLGMSIYNNTASNHGYYDALQNNGQFLGNLQKDYYNTEFKTPQYFSDYYVQKASFFRMDNITLGYNLNSLMQKKLRTRIYGSVDNLFVVSPYEGIDPELEGGIDNNVYPRPRTFTLGVNVSF